MNRFFKAQTFLILFSCMAVAVLNAAIRSADSESSSSDQPAQASASSDTTASGPDSAAAGDTTSNDEIPSEAQQPAKAASHHAPIATGEAIDQSNRADAFIAGPDWEFDGFVSGGQDSKVRGMFYLNDLLYLNIGSKQGLTTNEKLEVFKRGDKIYDPQTGHFLGYEVRRAAVVKVTDHIDDDTCSVRVVRTQEPVEIGDLVRRIQ